MNKDKILEASELMKKASDLLLEAVEEDEKPKAKVEIKFGHSRGCFEDMDELIEKFSKDLEEMLNDTTEKREG